MKMIVKEDGSLLTLPVEQCSNLLCRGAGRTARWCAGPCRLLPASAFLLV